MSNAQLTGIRQQLIRGTVLKNETISLVVLGIGRKTSKLFCQKRNKRVLVATEELVQDWSA